MKKKTLKKRKYLGNTLERTSSAYIGAMAMLQLVSRVEGTENVSPVVANRSALMLLQHFKGNF